MGLLQDLAGIGLDPCKRGNVRYGWQTYRQCRRCIDGEKTYQMMDSYWPQQQISPMHQNMTLSTHNGTKKVERIGESRFIRKIPMRLIPGLSEMMSHRKSSKIKEQPGGTILMIGSPSTYHELAAHNLVDEFWLF